MKRGKKPKTSVPRLGQGNGNGVSLTPALSCDCQGLDLDVSACAGPASPFCVEELKSCFRDGHQCNEFGGLSFPTLSSPLWPLAELGAQNRGGVGEGEVSLT